MNNISRRAERGSVLILILIAVALFAALGYAVSNMMQGGSGGVSIAEEQASVLAGEIIDHGRSVRQAVQAMRISNGCRDTEISFENPIVAGYTNGTNTDCQVFHPDGGGISWISSANGLNDGTEWVFSGSNAVTDIGSGSGDLVMVLMGVRQNICLSINDTLNIENPSGDAPGEVSGPAFDNFFLGAYSTANELGNNNTQLPGRPTGCFKETGTLTGRPDVGEYVFYQVLIAR